METEERTVNHKTLAPIIAAALLAGSLAAPAQTEAQNAAIPIAIDAAANRHAISPLIYGVNYGSQAVLDDLNSPINRRGGTPTSTYNWQQNAENVGEDYYFESVARNGSQPGAEYDSFISSTQAAGSQPYVTVPMLNWVAKLGPGRSTLPSFSVARYGAQQYTDPYWHDFGNGVYPNGQFITNNDPNDAMMPADQNFQAGWIQHMVGRFGASAAGGVRYYGLDNEPSIWFSTHRDVAPVGLTMEETTARTIAYSTMIRSVDPNAVILGPEEWGWSGFFVSGYDQWRAHRFGDYSWPDQTAHGGQEFSAYYLSQLRQHEQATGQRMLDVFALHYYPQGGEFGDDVSTAMQLRRNRSTRALWDPNYVDESWINDRVKLIPRMKDWVNTYYPGLKVGLTEYNWGAEWHINGATAQADILGILGREGADLALRWVAPDPASPVYKAMKMYRNYDGAKSTFGDVSVSATAPNPDDIAVFAAERTSDNAMTVMVICKSPSGSRTVNLSLANFTAGQTAQAFQLTSTNAVTRLGDIAVDANTLQTTLPAQSITLFVIAKGDGQPEPPEPPDPPATDPAVLTLLFPNGGERLRGGKTYTIAWQIDNVESGDVVSQEIALSTNSGFTYQAPFATGLSGDAREYRIRISTAGGSKTRCRFRVTAHLADGTTVVDESDADFRLR